MTPLPEEFAQMGTYRFTLNVTVVCADTPDEVSHVASKILDAMYAHGTGSIRNPDITGWASERRLKLSIDFDAPTFNGAHQAGMDFMQEAMEKAGYELVSAPGHRAAVGPHSGDDVDSVLEQILPHTLRGDRSSLELVG